MNLLLIMPSFFDYPKVISEELSSMGYSVDFIDDRPSTNPVVKALIRINRNFLTAYIKKYFDKVCELINGKAYDVVLLISGQSLSFSEEMIKQIKTMQPNAKFILYQWDSEKNFPYIRQFHKYFDKCFSFDRSDVQNNSELRFLPLFYSSQYEEIGNNKENNDYKYDYCFIGTAHPKKYRFVNEIVTKLKPIYSNAFIYYYFPSRLVYFYRKIFNVEFRKAKMGDFNYQPLKKTDIMQIYKESRCVLDSAQDGQTGLTIRVLEALGAKKKIITTNEDVVNYDFYKEENIYVYDGKIDMNHPFFNNKYVDIDPMIYEKYSLRSWLKEVLNDEKK